MLAPGENILGARPGGGFVRRTGASVATSVVPGWVAPLRRPDWGLLPDALKGPIFLLALVTCASLMPVERLPACCTITMLP